MEQPALVGFAQLLVAGLLGVVAAAVRFAGASRPLNIVDYSRVPNAAALHRWAGNRLFLASGMFAVSGVSSLQRPEWSVALLLLTVLACLGVLIWLAVGVGRFHHGR